MRDITTVVSDAFGNKSRFKILHVLTEKPLSVTEISELTGIEQTNISHNLKYLSKSRIVVYKNVGKKHIYEINYNMRGIVKIIMKDFRKHQNLLKKGGFLIFLAFLALKPLSTHEIGQFTLLSLSVIQPIKSILFAG